jgi:preprotein translocase subunit SecF
LFDIVGKRRWYFLGSGLVILVGIISLIVSGLNIGLDFKPGVTMTVVFHDPIEQEDLRAGFADMGYGEAVIQHGLKDAFLLSDLPADEQESELPEEPFTNTGNETLTEPGNATPAETPGVQIIEPTDELGNATPAETPGVQIIEPTDEPGNATPTETPGVQIIEPPTPPVIEDELSIDDLARDPDKKRQLAEDLQVRFDTTVRTARFDSAGNVTVVALMFGRTIEVDDLREELGNLGYPDIDIQSAALDSYLVRIGEPEIQDTAGTDTGLTPRERIKEDLASQFGPVDYLDYDSVSQAVASERVRYTGYAVLVAAVGILLYIAWSFRRLANSFRFGVCAIIALVHDALIVITVFSLFRMEVNSFFIIAILTVIGYGVNNVIVVFDRIRENRSRHVTAPLETVVNMSITETLTRSLNTSLTTLLVLLALLFFGGSTIHTFVLALTIGVVSATFTSLFIASELLVAWDKGELGRLFRWIPLRREK